MRRALPFLVAVLALAGCASPALAHRADEHLAAGHFAEVNVRLGQGETVRWDWSATETVHFNVHSHAGGGLVEHAVRDAASDQGSFTAPEEGSYSLFWQARSDTYLTYTVTGAGVLESATP